MARTIVTDEGLFVIPGGDPPMISLRALTEVEAAVVEAQGIEIPVAPLATDYPAEMDKRLFPEGEVAPTLSEARSLLGVVPEGKVCKQCIALLKDAPANTLAVDCGNHIWVDPSDIGSVHL